MTVMVALLRGVNVGAAGRVSMADVRAAVTKCGYSDVVSYVQSGNLVFTSTNPDTADVAARLREAIDESTPVQPDVVVRTRDDIHKIIRSNPFLDRGADPLQLHVVFLPDGVPASLDGVDLTRFAPEEAEARGCELFMYLPNGTGRSKLAAAIVKHTNSAGTQRNWRTVTKLAELADQLAAGV